MSNLSDRVRARLANQGVNIRKPILEMIFNSLEGKPSPSWNVLSEIIETEIAARNSKLFDALVLATQAVERTRSYAESGCIEAYNADEDALGDIVDAALEAIEAALGVEGE